jgi:hypothetical protein
MAYEVCRLSPVQFRLHVILTRMQRARETQYYPKAKVGAGICLRSLPNGIDISDMFIMFISRLSHSGSRGFGVNAPLSFSLLRFIRVFCLFHALRDPA